jgi:tRNA-specific 2-thiouridylase
VPSVTRVGSRGCCSLEDGRDARRVADVLGVPFYVWDLSQRFQAEVVDDFVAEYAAGRTPNPCLRCNEHIKFTAVLERAVALGFDAVVTGHYARRMVDGDGHVTLHRAADPGKDQSYVLAVLTAAQLRRSVFPLGDTAKPQVRAEAADRGLAVADKPDSHDICFVPDGDTAGFVTRHLGSAPGPVVDAATGATLGRHDGTHGFTIGQRRGLRLDRSADDGRPRYVLSLEPVSRTVVVGARDALAVSAVETGVPTWCSGPPASSASDVLVASAQYRAHGEAVESQVQPHHQGLLVTFAEPQHAVAPGQTVAFYRGDQVLGSATIARTRGR